MTRCIVARQALLSKEFSRQEHWSGLLSPPGNLPSPGVDPGTSALPANSLPTEPSEVVNEYIYIYIHIYICINVIMATQLFLAILHKYLCFITYLFLAYCILVLTYKLCLFSEYKI